MARIPEYSIPAVEQIRRVFGDNKRIIFYSSPYFL